MDNNVTIITVVVIDSPERLSNVKFFYDFYSRKTNNIPIMIIEVGSYRSLYFDECDRLQYSFIKDDSEKLNLAYYYNMAYEKCESSIICSIDVDILIDSNIMDQCINGIKNSQYYFAIPYNQVYDTKRCLSISELSPQNCQLIDKQMGGCLIFEKGAFFSCGFENERLCGWGYRNIERYTRIEKCGYEIYEAIGCAFHMHHTYPLVHCLKWYNSSTLDNNLTEYQNVLNMNVYDLKKYIYTMSIVKINIYKKQLQHFCNMVYRYYAPKSVLSNNVYCIEYIQKLGTTIVHLSDERGLLQYDIAIYVSSITSGFGLQLADSMIESANLIIILIPPHCNSSISDIENTTFKQVDQNFIANNILNKSMFNNWGCVAYEKI